LKGLGQRSDALAAIDNGAFDVLVVGGGIAGAGVLLEAALRGYRAALVERRDFASGTSSRSSKLVHGGLRYVAQGQLGIVRDSLRERADLLRTAPTLVRPMPHLFPLRSRAHALAVRATLVAYDLLGSRPRHRVLSSSEAAEQEPRLAGVAAHGAASYSEAQVDDVRLVFAALAAAAASGAVAVNHVAARRWTARGGGMHIELRDELAAASLVTQARVVVLAIGSWLDSSQAPVELRPAKGIHLVLKETPPRNAIIGRSPRDGRYLTIMPWHGHVLVGTTDTPASREELDDPRPNRDDVAYLLEGARPFYPDAAEHIRAAWAGIRPLVDARATNTARLSREEQIVSPEPNVYAIAGGKLTTFRAIGRRVLDIVDERLGRPPQRTAVALVDPLPIDGLALAPDLPFTQEQLIAGARLGMVATLDDLLTHRLGITLVAPDSVIAHASEWAQLAGAELGWSPTTVEREAAAATRQAHDLVAPP
jgi:glycerol-3-phosphate dehydrogenase